MAHFQLSAQAAPSYASNIGISWNDPLTSVGVVCHKNGRLPLQASLSGQLFHLLAHKGKLQGNMFSKIKF